MKSLVLWGAAIAVALYLVARYRKGASKRLAGRYSIRFVQMVSILLFAAGCGTVSGGDDTPKRQPERQPQPAKPAEHDAASVANDSEESSNVIVKTPIVVPSQDRFPKLSADKVNHWLFLQNKGNVWTGFKLAATTNISSLGQSLGSWDQVRKWTKKLSSALVPKSFIDLAQEAPDKSTDLTLSGLQAILAEMETEGFFDTWLVGYLWHLGHTAQGTAAERAELYAQLESHHRVAEVLTLAAGQSKVSRPRPWMSKASPPPGYHRNVKPTFANPTAFLREAQVLYRKHDSGTWQSQARIAIALESGTATLHRRGQEVLREAGQSWHLRRLDVLVATSACKVRLPYLGVIDVPQGMSITSVSMATLLSASARERGRALIAAAMEGDSAAMDKVALLFPMISRDVRTAVSQAPDAKGAALRTLLFDADW